MYPPIFAICSANAGVQAVLGSNANCRLFPFGEAPQGESRPYAVWTEVTGLPENYLNQTPDIDSFTIQIDSYATSASGARSVAEAIRDAVEGYAHVTSWDGESRDPETNLYRYIFSVDWWVNRS